MIFFLEKHRFFSEHRLERDCYSKPCPRCVFQNHIPFTPISNWQSDLRRKLLLPFTIIFPTGRSRRTDLSRVRASLGLAWRYLALRATNFTAWFTRAIASESQTGKVRTFSRKSTPSHLARSRFLPDLNFDAESRPNLEFVFRLRVLISFSRQANYITFVGTEQTF